MPLKLNKIVWSKLHKILSFFTKKTGFQKQSIDDILKYVSVAETIDLFKCGHGATVTSY